MTVETGLRDPRFKALFNGLAAAIISYVFISVLMLAAAQQRVAASLTRQDPTLDYSTARLLVSEDNSRISARKNIISAMREDQTAYNTATAANLRDYDALNDTWLQIEGITSSIRVNSKCDLPVSDKGTLLVEKATVWYRYVSVLKQCVNENFVPAAISQELSNTKVLQSFNKAYLQFGVDYATSNNFSRKLISDQAELNEIPINAVDKAGMARLSFNELSVFDNQWLFVAGLLLQIPPTMMLILLSFISGLFGALLITLVLVVYPNELPMKSDGDYSARTLLGGLIALCVYVVLNSGASVLGATVNFQEGQANYMTYCAVGILAGMFSDRVAAWLSDRAKLFFKIDDTTVDTVAKQKPGVVVPPAG